MTIPDIYIPGKAFNCRSTHYDRPSAAYLIVVSFTLAFFTIALFLHFEYSTNDDYGNIKLLRAGDFSPNLGLLLNAALVALYKTNRLVPWYGLSLGLAALLGLINMFMLPPRVVVARIQLATYASFFAAAVFITTVTPTYTSIAIVLGSCSILCIYKSFLFKCSRYRLLSLGFAGLFLAANIRMESLIASTAYTLPVVLICVLKIKHRILCILKTSIVVFLVWFIFLFANNIVVKHIASDEYVDYLLFFHTSTSILGYPGVITDGENFLRQAKWNISDLSAFLRFDLFSESKFNIRTLRILKLHWKTNTTFSYVSAMLNNVIHRDFGWICSLLFLWLVLCATKQLRWFQFSLFLLYFFGIVALFTLFLRFPERISNPFYISTFAVQATLMGNWRSKLHYKCLYAFVSCFCIACTIVYFFLNRSCDCDVEERLASIQTINTLYDDSLIMPYYCDSIVYYTTLFHENYIENILPNGWLSFSPSHYALLRKHGFSSNDDLYKEITLADGIFFITSPWCAKQTTKTLRERGLPVELQFDKQIASYSLYRVSHE